MQILYMHVYVLYMLYKDLITSGELNTQERFNLNQINRFPLILIFKYLPYLSQNFLST